MEGGGPRSIERDLQKDIRRLIFTANTARRIFR